MDDIETMAIIPRLRREDQREIARHPARYKVVACGRRWGKTTLGMAMAIHDALKGKRVWWVAPTYLIAFHMWLGFKQRLAGLCEFKAEAQHHLALIGGGSLTVKSADNPDGLRGVGVDFVVLDEAAFMTDYIWMACLRPALADRKGRALFISTPKGRNWFFHAYQRGADPEIAEWEAWRFPTEHNRLIGAEEIEEARQTLPARTFQQEYEARFLEDGGTVFRKIYEAATATPPAEPIPGHRYVMGVDFGRYEDFTAVVVIDADEKTMVALDRYNEAEWRIQRGRIAALARTWNIWSILAESNAMGEPNIEELWREGLPIQGFKTTAQSKSTLIEGLVLAIENGDIKLLNDPVLLGELESYTYRKMPSGITTYETAAGRHDDTVIALALAWKVAATPRIALAIAVV